MRIKVFVNSGISSDIQYLQVSKMVNRHQKAHKENQYAKQIAVITRRNYG